MVEQESDAQYLMIPVMLPLTFSYILAIQSIDAPESWLSVVSSFIPFSAPISMMVRLPMGVPWWHVAVSLGLLAGHHLVLGPSGRPGVPRGHLDVWQKAWVARGLALDGAP
jgi:ABC-type Na+ efflux pump permease subunit